MSVSLVVLLLASAQGPLLPAGRAWLSVHVDEVAAPADDRFVAVPSTTEVRYRCWRPLGNDEHGPSGRLVRSDVHAVRQGKTLHLEVGREEYVDLLASDGGESIAELRVAPVSSSSTDDRPRNRSVTLTPPPTSEERGFVELDLATDGTLGDFFAPPQYALAHLSPSGQFWLRRTGSATGDIVAGRPRLTLLPGRHLVAVTFGPAWKCASGGAIPDFEVYPRAILDVMADAMTCWAPVVSRGATFELHVDCPTVALPPEPTGTELAPRLVWNDPLYTGELTRWCAARLISHTTGEVHEPEWGWRYQLDAWGNSVFPIGVDVFAIERLPLGAYTLELRGPGIAPVTRVVCLTQPEMEPLVVQVEGCSLSSSGR